MPSLSKRRFLQLAGLSISNRILPGWLRAQEPAGRGAANKVIVVTFGGGVRYSETFAPEGLHNIPRLTAMRPEGHFFKILREFRRALAFQFDGQHFDRQLAAGGRFRLPASGGAHVVRALPQADRGRADGRVGRGDE